MAKRRKAKRRVSASRRRSGLRGALSRAIDARDRWKAADAAGKLRGSLRPVKDYEEADLLDQLERGLRSGRASDATDPRIQALIRKLVRQRRSPIEEAPWFLESRIATLQSYCVAPGSILSHYIRDAKDPSRIIWSGNLAIANDFGRFDSWRAYRNRARAKLREVIQGHPGSWEMWALIEDRCP